jgi:transcription elongation GreA/GreB family factor
MAELVALRTILLNVLYKQANGEDLTAEEMQRLIERADTDKLKKAQARLEQAAVQLTAEDEGQEGIVDDPSAAWHLPE